MLVREADMENMRDIFGGFSIDKEKQKEDEQEKEPEKPKEIPKEKPKETPKEKPKEMPKEKPKETPKEKPKESPKEKLKEKPKEKPKGSTATQIKGQEQNVKVAGNVLTITINKPTADTVPTPATTTQYDTFDPSNLQTESHFQQYASLLAKKISPYEKNANYLKFVKSLLKQTTKTLSKDELKELSKAFNNWANDKISMEKKKKPTKTKQQLNTRDVDDFFDDEYD